MTETLADIRSEARSGADSEGGAARVDEGGSRPRRGRPPGSKSRARETEAPALKIDPRAIGPLLSFPFDYLAKRRGEHWKLTDEERTMLADLTVPVIDKYAGTIAERWGAEIALGLALGSVITVRMMQDAAKAESPLIDVRGEPHEGEYAS